MRRQHPNRLRSPLAACALLVIAAWFLLAPLARAQTQTPDPQNAPSGTSQSEPAPQDPETVFPHPDSTRWWISGQFNSILQAHPTFRALYSGAHSLDAVSETHDSRVLTLYTGLEVARWTEILFDGESTGGRGLSDALGLAGFTDLDVVRNPNLSATPYLARLMIHQIIPLSQETTAQDRGPLDLFTQVPVRRLEFRFGKMTLPDFFDINSVGGDDHLQFMNWTDANNGAYDYAADARGYTWAAMLEYDDRGFAVRFAEALMPTVANGINLDWDVARARAENIEVEFHPTLLAGRPSAIRLLSFVNHGNMGDYAQAVALFRAGKTPVPVIEDTRRQGAIKYGFGVNLEQDLTGRWRAFSRFGWNEGQHESFVYTEVDQTFELGTDYRGSRWNRDHDKVGLAFVTNGISRDHQEYLRLGGLGFLLGDGNLTYGRENIFEWYYNAHFWRGVYASADLQHVTNPGYNRDRGPVWVPAIRIHVEL